MGTYNNGIFRMATAKGKGYWLARWNDQERVFYDGSYGTSVASENAAKKWHREQQGHSKEALEFQDNVAKFMDWLDTKKGEYGEKIVDEVGSKVVQIIAGWGDPLEEWLKKSPEKGGG